MVETFARMRSVIATRCSTDSCAWRPGGEETELGAIFTRSFYYSFLWNIPRNDQLLLVANKTLTLGWKKSSNHRETLLTFVSVYMWTKAAFFWGSGGQMTCLCRTCCIIMLPLFTLGTQLPSVCLDWVTPLLSGCEALFSSIPWEHRGYLLFYSRLGF